MEWEDLEPIVKVVPRAQASVYVNKDGKPRIRVFFSETMLGECGHPEAANVQFGVRDGKVLLRCVWSPQGKFNMGDLGRGGARLQNIPSKPPAPDGARDGEPCEVESKSKIEAVLILPIEAWAAQLNQAGPARVAANVPKASLAAAPRPQSATKLDAVYYLRSKGVKISKLAGDWWTLDGTKIPRIEVLSRVNAFRRSAAVPSLGVDDIE